jgi:hypothetical protein
MNQDLHDDDSGEWYPDEFIEGMILFGVLVFIVCTTIAACYLW